MTNHTEWLDRNDLVELNSIRNGQRFIAIDGHSYTKKGYIKDNPSLAVIAEKSDGTIHYFCPSAHAEAK